MSRRGWWPALLPLAGVVALAGGTLIVHAVQQPDPTDGTFLSPVSDAGDGSAVLAARLTAHGVEVDRRTGTPEAISAVVADGDATLFVPAPGLVHPEYLHELSLIPASSRVVLVAPEETALDAAGLDVQLAGPRWTAAAPEPGCAEPFATAPAAVLRWQFGPAGATRFRCYADGVVELDRGGTSITLVGASDPFRNDRLDEHGNAAFAVGLLARSSRVVWLDLHERETLPVAPGAESTDPIGEPDPDAEEPAGEYPESGGDADREPADPGTGGTEQQSEASENPLVQAFPPAFWATVLVLLIAVLAFAAAAARRLGTPVAEPLPTRVHAAETVRGLGALYRRAHARDASLRTLQAAAVSRLSDHFGLAPGAGVDEVAARVAAEHPDGRPAHEVHALLGGGVEDTDEDLAVQAVAVQNLVRHVTGQQGDEGARQINDEGNLW